MTGMSASAQTDSLLKGPTMPSSSRHPKIHLKMASDYEPTHSGRVPLDDTIPHLKPQPGVTFAISIGAALPVTQGLPHSTGG